MAICEVCHCEIPRGKRYKTDKYKSYAFCCEDCYKEFLAIKSGESKSLIKLKKYIDKCWNGQVNWPFMGKQIATMREEYSLTYKELYLVLKYAVTIEGYVVDTAYGLQQFVKFIQPAQDFIDRINKAKEADIPEEQIIYIKPCTQKRRKVKEEDWD